MLSEPGRSLAVPQNALPGVPLIESPLFQSWEKVLPASLATIARSLHDHGFAMLDFPEEDFERISTELIEHLEPLYDLAGWRARKARGEPGGLRIQDGAILHEHVQRIACNASVVDLLSRLYGRAAFPFQTLNFAVGSEQHFHTDSLHFSSIPERFMCGVWVALEDVSPDQGPLVYYPGSHKLPIFWNEHYGNRKEFSHLRNQQEYEHAWRQIVESMGFSPQYFCPRRGQMLIWAANLLHGGAFHKDPSRTRWSQVTHYYFEDCAYVTPIYSDTLLSGVTLRDVVDLRTGKVVEHKYLGVPLPDQAHVVGVRPPARYGLPADFDPHRYLDLNPDVRTAGVDAVSHFLAYGVNERRRYK